MTNETKHTPGPWYVGMKPGPIIYGLRGAQVADLSARMVPDDETRGNVRLVAAAPELLAALRELVDNNMGQPRGVTVPQLDKARTAIANAIG